MTKTNVATAIEENSKLFEKGVDLIVDSFYFVCIREMKKVTEMPSITFKAKVQTVYNMDDTVAWQFVKVPKITRSHCDMNAFRNHPKFGSYANSDLFQNLINRQLKLACVGENIRLDKIPDGVEIDMTGFLAEVTINIK